mgnify:FL=1
MVITFLFNNVCIAQNVGIGTTAPTNSALLELNTTSKGFLPPRMTISQRDLILNPSQGLIIYCTNCIAPAGEIEVYNGYNWTNLIGEISFTGTVKICAQVWMKKNLDVNKYRNGDSIPQVTSQIAWQNLTTGAWCWYNNDSATYASTYGKLYNWYAVNDPRGLAPHGWHVPSDPEWSTLAICLGGSAVAGGKMKEVGTSHWASPNTGATNSSGFLSLPGGNRSSDGSFGNIGAQNFLFSSTEFNNDNAWYSYLEYSSANIFRANYNKTFGFTVRCLRD